MFDTVYLPFKCPKCGYKTSRHDWQTKSFARTLAEYKPGDIPQLDDFEVVGGKFEIHTACPKCKAYVISHGYIKDSKITKNVDVAHAK